MNAIFYRKSLNSCSTADCPRCKNGGIRFEISRKESRRDGSLLRGVVTRKEEEILFNGDDPAFFLPFSSSLEIGFANGGVDW